MLKTDFGINVVLLQPEIKQLFIIYHHYVESVLSCADSLFETPLRTNKR